MDKETMEHLLNMFIAASTGILRHAHRVAEDADLDDNHPFWEWIEDLNDAVLANDELEKTQKTIVIKDPPLAWSICYDEFSSPPSKEALKKCIKRRNKKS